MSEFEVRTYPAKISPHPDPETTELDIINVGNFKTIIKKGYVKDGDTIAYIPEQAIVPDNILEEMNLVGRLSGSKKNRVKAIKLRGVLSQGLAYPMIGTPIDIDVAEQLGIVKYERPLPSNMQGKPKNAAGKTLQYPLPDIKKTPDIFAEEDYVIMTEKLHGTWCCLGVYKGEPIVTSKGLSGKEICLDVTDDSNLYVQQWNKLGKHLWASLSGMFQQDAWYVLGEIVGPGVQDLHYNLPEKQFFVFDIWLGDPHIGRFLEWGLVKKIVNELQAEGMNIQTVPEVYEGPFNEATLHTETNRQSSMLSPGHIREGVIVKTHPERTHPRYGRMKFKSINENYLLRKGDTTEYN